MEPFFVICRLIYGSNTRRFGAQSQQVDLHKVAGLLKGHGD